MGDHMPVHLGSMPTSVRAAIQSFDLEPGHVAMRNHPFRVGTHRTSHWWRLCNIGSKQRGQDALAAAGEDGAASARRLRPRRGSGRPDFDVTLLERITRTWAGLIPSRWTVPRDRSGRAAYSAGSNHACRQNGTRCSGAVVEQRTHSEIEREGDLGAQIAACHTGAERLREICHRYGLKRASRAAGDLLDYSEQMTRAFSGAGA